jgi:uncharacterized Fe-S cluster-containing radical SAM superfamily protein
MSGIQNRPLEAWDEQEGTRRHYSECDSGDDLGFAAGPLDFARANNFRSGVFAGHERQELRRRMMRNPGGAAIAATVAIGLVACAMGLGSSSETATSSSAQAEGGWSTNLSGLEPSEAVAAMVEVAGAAAAAVGGRPAMGSDD